jgi:DNA/RNA-binding domain of Phe-tRNA-synthetase-like protein
MDGYSELKVDARLQTKFPGLKAVLIDLEGVSVKREVEELEAFKGEVVERTLGAWTLDQLREEPTIRAYRDFFWRVGVDPTKTRPSSEALIRRMLRGSPLPKINSLVDTYNLASIDSAIPIAAFDVDKLSGEMLMREAVNGEEFMGIGMKKQAVLNGGEPVVTDDERLVAIYPYRDADFSKVTVETGKVSLMICGVPNIGAERLEETGALCVEYITRFCGGVRA